MPSNTRSHGSAALAVTTPSHALDRCHCAAATCTSSTAPSPVTSTSTLSSSSVAAPPTAKTGSP